MQILSEVPMTCPGCAGEFKFPREGIGQVAPCPHCGLEVSLVEATPAVVKTVKRKFAGKLQTKIYTGGIEDRLDFVCVLLVFACGLSGVVAILVGFNEGSSSGYGLIGAGVAAIISGLFAGVVCKGLGEIIRLLKKSNGLPYSDRIHESHYLESVFHCSDCNAEVSDDARKCHRCNSEFTSEK